MPRPFEEDTLEQYASLTDLNDYAPVQSETLGSLRTFTCPKGPEEPDPLVFAKAFLEQPPFSFADLKHCRFYDRGVYSIQYHGSFPIYQSIASNTCPIYLGSAVDTSLRNRLRQHSKTIEKASSTLSIEDFTFRVMPLKWMAQSVETALIELFDPTWNDSGFGHRPGENRTREGSLPKWHTLHPGGGKPGDPRELSSVKIAFEQAVMRNLSAYNKALRKLGVDP